MEGNAGDLIDSLLNYEGVFWQSGLAGNTLRIAAVLLLAFLASSLLARLLRIVVGKMVILRDDPDSGKRAETVRRTGTTIGRIAIWSVAGFTVLSILGISIAPLLTAAGVAGIAAGFAAQSLVKDYFSGFIILLEGQLRVDDIVEIGGHIGVVEEITLRSVRLRDYDGNVIFVPCGNITNVVNMTMEYSRSVIDVGIAYREKTDEALGIMHSVASQMAQDRAFADRIIDEPEIVGVEMLGDSAVILRLRLKVTPGAQWEVRREFFRRIKQAFDETGIEIPFPHLTLYPGLPKDGPAPPLNIMLGQTEAGVKNA